MEAKHDTLNLRNNSKTKRMLSKNGVNKPKPEVVKYSAYIMKINRKDKQQKRLILVTDKAIYNMNNPGKCKRRIPLTTLAGVTASSPGLELVVHVPIEYDYRYKTNNAGQKKELLQVLTDVYKVLPGFSNRTLVRYSEKRNLKDVAVTQAEAKLMNREQRKKRQEELLNQGNCVQEEQTEQTTTTDNKTSKFYALETRANPTKVDLTHFKLIKVLGRGSFGKVMLVQKTSDEKFYAMKILKKNHIIQHQQIDNTRAERNILRQLDHPFLMTLRFAFQSKVKLYLVLDFYQGGELFYHLKIKQRFSERTAKIYIGEIALALGHLHALGVIYRDLKPENILLDPQGHVCLTDFGLAKELEDGQQTISFCGTPEYLAPEIVSGLGHDKAVDWWSLGILLYELTVGIPPFFSQNVHEMYHAIQHGSLRFPQFLSESCKSIIIALLNRDPAARLGSTDDVNDLKNHEFYDDIDWEELYDKKIIPDYQPETQGADQAALFDPTFTKEEVQETPEVASTLVNNNADAFDGFTFQPTNNGI